MTAFKKPPKYGEEVRRIAEDGLKKHKAKGNVVSFDGPIAGSDIIGPDGKVKATRNLPRKARVKFLQLTQIAIAALAQGDHQDWEGALMELKALMKAHNWKHGTFLEVCRQIEHCAVDASQNPYCGTMARHWLQSKKDRLRFMPVH